MSTPPIIWSCKKFEDLTVPELYTILKLRNEVFVVEQNCVYPDMDGKDIPSLHLCGWLNNQLLVAYARLIPAGIAYTEASIGRVVSNAAYRKNGYGKKLMQKAIDSTTGSIALHVEPDNPAFHLYKKLGFTNKYLEMRLTK